MRGLLRRALDNDSVALHELLRRLTPYLARVSRALLRHSSTEPDDCVQESLLALLRALPAFRGDSTVTYFATRIAFRCTLAARRRARLSAERVESAADFEAPRAALSSQLDDEAVLAQRRTALRQLLEQLPEAQCRAFTLRVVLGYSFKEVARAQGSSVNTVRSRIRLARDTLRRRIEQDPALVELFGRAPVTDFR